MIAMESLRQRNEQLEKLNRVLEGALQECQKRRDMLMNESVALLESEAYGRGLINDMSKQLASFRTGEKYTELDRDAMQLREAISRQNGEISDLESSVESISEKLTLSICIGGTGWIIAAYCVWLLATK